MHTMYQAAVPEMTFYQIGAPIPKADADRLLCGGYFGFQCEGVLRQQVFPVSERPSLVPGAGSRLVVSSGEQTAGAQLAESETNELPLLPLSWPSQEGDENGDVEKEMKERVMKKYRLLTSNCNSFTRSFISSVLFYEAVRAYHFRDILRKVVGEERKEEVEEKQTLVTRIATFFFTKRSEHWLNDAKKKYEDVNKLINGWYARGFTERWLGGGWFLEPKLKTFEEIRDALYVESKPPGLPERVDLEFP